MSLGLEPGGEGGNTSGILGIEFTVQLEGAPVGCYVLGPGGGGFLGGMGGFASIIGLLLQIALVVIVAMLLLTVSCFVITYALSA